MSGDRFQWRKLMDEEVRQAGCQGRLLRGRRWLRLGRGAAARFNICRKRFCPYRRPALAVGRRPGVRIIILSEVERLPQLRGLCCIVLCQLLLAGHYAVNHRA